jgi:hypothetical protein
MKTIAWDVDDTLNNFTQVWFNDWWHLDKKSLDLNYSQLTENPPNHLLGISEAAYLASLDAFRSSELAGAISPNSQILDWFQRYGEKSRHLALTATPLNAAPYSAAWVLKHFGKWIRSYNVIPSKREGDPLQVHDQNKTEFLDWLGKVDILVEDNEANLISAQRAGYLTIGIPQPWNNVRNSLEDILAQLTTYLDG